MNERSYRGRSARARRPEKRAAVAAAGATRSKRSFFDLRINDSHLGFQLPRSQRLHLHPHLELSTVFDPAGVLTCVIAQQQLCHSAYQHSERYRVCPLTLPTASLWRSLPAHVSAPVGLEEERHIRGVVAPALAGRLQDLLLFWLSDAVLRLPLPGKTFYHS